MKRFFIFASLILFVYGTEANSQSAFTSADSAKYNAYWWHSKDMFDNLPDIKGEIIFLGNSITDGAEWFELFNNRKCLNRGISGDITEGVLLRLNNIIGVNPAKIFLMIGVNDLSKGRSVEEISSTYRQILDQIKAGTPKTKVYIESVLPVNPASGQFKNHTNKTEQIMKLNENLKMIASEYGYQYVDLFSLLADKDNHLSRKYSVDGLHLTYAAYKVWVEAIREYVK